MKAIVFKETGTWTDKLELTEVQLTAPAADEVQISIKARPINPSDEMFISGVYRQKPVLPQIAGLEGAGVIVQCGEAVNPLLLGKHVAFRARNTWAEQVNLKPSQFRIVPDSLPFETACQLSLNTLTAFALVESAGLSANQWLLVTAANSSVSKQVIQLAKERSLRVIAVIRNDAHREALLALGADAVLNSENQNIEEEVKTITGDGVNAILDAVGGKLGTLLFRIAAPYSKIIIYGRLSADDVSFSYADVIYKNMTIAGFGIDRWLNSKNAETLNAYWNELISMVEAGKLQVNHDEVFALADFKEAISFYKRTGKRVILK